MDWGSVLAIGALNVTLIGWLRSDAKRFETKIEGWKDEVQHEMRDFHGRLCAIETEKRNNKGEK